MESNITEEHHRIARAPDMIERRSWAEFRATGLLWWINRSLHLFGWAIVVEVDAGQVVDCFPARCKFRGFAKEIDDQGFVELTTYLRAQSESLANEVQEESDAN